MNRFFISATLLLAVVEVASAQPSTRQKYLRSALQVHLWLQSVQRQDAQGRCYWPNSPDQDERTSWDLYHGDLGVIRFYRQLYLETRDPKYLAIAESAMARVLAILDSDASSLQPGLYTGIAGVGWEAAELWKVTRKQIYREATFTCFQKLNALAKRKNGKPIRLVASTDIISGHAGIGIFLIQIFELFEHQDAFDLAIQLGDQMIADAIPGNQESHLDGKSQGVRWKMNDRMPRDYPNYSHGTAGNADFLVSLHRACKNANTFKSYDGRYLRVARQAADYLVSISKTKDQGRLIFHHTPGGEQLYYLGWCHGPAGTGRFFLNLAAVTNEKKYEQLGLQSARALLLANLHKNRTEGFWNNCGQCCGSAGVAEFLAWTYQNANRDPQYLETCRQLTDDILQRASQVELPQGKRGIKWVHAENRVDPKGLKAQTGYMQGAAGIGCWLLKMHRLENRSSK